MADPTKDLPVDGQLSKTGQGGERHQKAAPGDVALTTAQGVVIADNQNSLSIGTPGPLLMQDFILREKIFHFDHERIPERVVHARGYGAHGEFTCSDAIPDVTRAAPFQSVGKATDVFVRFSTVQGSKGSADLARDVRGFAVKFYTEEGNWDLVGNNIPVFFIQDPMKFPDLVHALKPEPDRDFPQAQSAHDNFWDYISFTPESMHAIMWVMSDRSIPRSFRAMQGFGVHTFRFVNAAGQPTFVKFHWKPRQGLQSVLWDEAVKINGADPDHHRRDLWDAIRTGDYPEWTLNVQLFDQDFADKFDFDILDPTKIIPEELLPLREIGTLRLDRLVDNFFAETEQVAFCTQNVIPGIDFTDDPLLQGRNFSYLDTQLKRLGSPNFTRLPVNAPRGCPVHNFQRDGHMQTAVPRGRVNYEPNGWNAGPREHPLDGYVSYAVRASGTVARLRPDSFADHYSQARQFYQSQTAIEQGHLRHAFIFELSRCEHLPIRERMVGHLRLVDEDLATQVAEGLGITPLPTAPHAARPTKTDLPVSDALSILLNGPGSFCGRVLGVLASNGAPAAVLAALTDAVAEAGARMQLVAPQVGGFIDSDGVLHPAHHRIDAGKSVLFDAVAVLLGPEEAGLVASMPAAQDFLRDAHAHCKFIGLAGAEGLVSACGLSRRVDDGYHVLDMPGQVESFLTDCAGLRFWDREKSLPG